MIGEGAFSDFVSVRDVHLTETLIKISGDAFNENMQLKSINFPENLKNIISYAFS